MPGRREWELRVGSAFDFLLDHGFVRDPDSAFSEWYGTSAVYRSSFSAVQVTHSVEFGRVEMHVFRLVDGELPPPEIFFEDDAPMNRTLFDNVLEARAPDRSAETQQATGLGEDQVDQQLALWSRLLRDVAPDFLDGGHDLFAEAKEIVRKRVQAHPQSVTVWLPRGASPEREAQAVEDARLRVPSEVPVVSRRYERANPAARLLRRLRRRT